MDPIAASWVHCCMRYTTNPVRPGLTAIAAVLALSSTPSFAQAADPAAAPLVTPPPVVAAPASTSAPAAAPAVQSAAPASGGLVTVPIRPGPVTVQPSAAPAPILTEDTPATPVIRSTARTTATRTAPVAAPRVTTAPATTAKNTATAAPTPVSAERVAPIAPVIAPTPAPAPVAKAPAAAQQTSGNDDILPIAGAAGAAILLLGGGLYAASRRRRPVEGEVYAVDTMDTPVTPAPEFYAAPVAAPVMAKASRPIAQPHGFAAPGYAPVNKLPSGFDTSRFGRYTQAAYQGPTADNPFLSLRRRLKRASFYDGRERMAAEGGAPIADRVMSTTAQTTPAPRQTEFVTTRVQRPTRPAFRPAYSN